MSHLRASESELERFRQLIRGMSYHSAIYKLLRDELSAKLSAKGNWKAAPRSKPGLANLSADSCATDM